MKKLQTFCARLALDRRRCPSSASGCASDPFTAGGAVAAGFVSGTSEVASSSRTVFNALAFEPNLRTGRPLWKGPYLRS